jgi:hypothetical protein
MTRFTFTSAERDIIQSAYNTSKALYDDPATTSAEGIFTPTYDALLSILNAADSSRFGGDDRDVQKWIAGAREVNGGSGLFKDFIRIYTVFQHQTRYGSQAEADPIALAQSASNGVANRY